jgi:hypothetical protein
MENLIQLAESMRQAEALLSDEDPEDALRQASSFLNVIVLGNVVRPPSLLGSVVFFFLCLLLLAQLLLLMLGMASCLIFYGHYAMTRSLKTLASSLMNNVQYNVWFGSEE